MEWLAMVPDVALCLTAVVSFIMILFHGDQRDSDTWWGKFKLAVYVVQCILCVVALIVVGMVS